jgi:invasion protein IalB
MLRCNHPAAAPSVCEVVQSVTNQERTVAQIVFGEVGHGQPLRLTILVPPSVTLATEAALGTGHEGEAPVVDFTWRRCLSGYCVADAAISEETLQRVRAWTEVARVTFSDAAGHAVVVPFSPRGLPQALDALAKEEG